MDCVNDREPDSREAAREKRKKQRNKLESGEVVVLVFFSFNLQPFFHSAVFQLKEKSHLNCHCILALDTLEGGLILALIQSHNNRGEIPLQVQ